MLLEYTGAQKFVARASKEDQANRYVAIDYLHNRSRRKLAVVD